MINKLLTNPFYIYVVSGLFLLGIYQLGWSTLFPMLSVELKIFLGITFFVSICFGIVFQKGIIRYYPYKNSFSYKPIFMTLVIVALFFIDYLYTGFLPIMRVDLDYSKYGAPGIHVVLISLSVFHAVTLFYIYLSKKSKEVLIQYVFVLILQILLLRRSNILWILFASFVIFLQQSKPIRIGKIVKYLLFLILIINLLFGLFSDFRNHLGKNHAIKYMGASNKFIQSGLNNSFYMFYLYSVSPIANLQSNINVKSSEGNLSSNFFDYVVINTLPESLKKRLVSSLDIVPQSTKTVLDVLNVSTIYSSPFSYLGWIGAILIFFYFLSNIFLGYIISPPGTTFHVVINSLLCCSVVFCWFDNIFHLITTFLLLFIYPLFYRLYVSSVKIIKNMSTNT